jgi:hypothetical protein
MRTTAEPKQENEKILKNTFVLILLFIVVLLFLCFFSGNLSAQDIKRDSLRRTAFIRDSLTRDSMAYASKIISIARWDARKLKLSFTQTQEFKADIKNNRSDFFKPQRKFVSDTTLMLDSVYVKAFRLAAYEKAIDDNSNIQKCYWVAAGFGPSSLGFLSLGANINGELPGRQLITANIIGDTQSLLGGSEETNFGLLYGHIFKQGSFFFTVSAGISAVYFETADVYLFSTMSSTKTSQSGVGVPILIQGYFVAGQVVGFGVNAYVNINSIQTTAGLTLTLALGRLSTHERKTTIH